CDRKTTQRLNTDCQNCRRNRRQNCPAGYIKKTRGQGIRRCRYRIHRGRHSRPVKGCYHECMKAITVPKCCANHWGTDCQEVDTCGNRGICYDGLSGNGTCSCRGRIGGSACEICSAPNQYGPSCEHDCACVHGKCDSGVDRPGICSCESGYGGARCNIVLAECASLNCHVNSRCLNTTGSLMCICNSGYQGDGVTCEEINPCQDTGSNLCHRNASCIHDGPGKPPCQCNRGFSGDGQYCGPIDPCQFNYGDCPTNSTICVYTGPGQSTCNCKPGYTDQTSEGCQLVDICGGSLNTTCDPLANCTTVDAAGLISVKCQCPETMFSWGLSCFSDIMSELIAANETGPFQNQLNMAINMFTATYNSELSVGDSLVTVFAPIDSAFGSELSSPNSSFLWKARARMHIVPGSIALDFAQQSANTMYPLFGYNTSIKALRPTGRDSNPDDDDAGYYAILSFSNMLTNGKIMASNRWASNGTFSTPAASVWDAIATNPITSTFYSLLKKSQPTKEFLRSGQQTTLFVPTNDAFDLLSTETMKFLTSEAGENKLDMILLYHATDQPVTSFELLTTKKLATSSGYLLVNISQSDGIIYIGLQKAKVSNKRSNIYLINKVLIPIDAEPLLGNFCPKEVEIEVKGLCGDCSNLERLCGPNAQRCTYNARDESGFIGQRLGCSPRCLTNQTTSACCPGFFGSACNSCPGPTHNACNMKGVCDDGISGGGLCTCNNRHTGPDCSVCTSPQSYGPECYLNCTCLYGRCDNTISSRGVCIAGSCMANWAGENCDRRVQPCGDRSLQCHQHGTCVEVDNVESCACDIGYTGNGMDCVEFNPCDDTYDSGGCDVNADCLYFGRGNYSCRCKLFYRGDGRSCAPINPCTDGLATCHRHAECIFTGPGSNTCQCLPGYRGNGQICDEINLCLENNGGCHYRATCTSNGPGTSHCECNSGYTGDGSQCVGSLLMEIQDQPQLSVITNFIQNNQIIRYTEVTAFLPQKEAWLTMSIDDFQYWNKPNRLIYLLKHHIVKGSITTHNLQMQSSLPTFLPTAPISVTNITYTREIMVPKIVVADLKTFNGLYHIIDDVLIPPRDVVQDHPMLQDIVQFAKYSLFFSMLNNSGIIADIISSGQMYTIFAVSNAIFEKFCSPTIPDQDKNLTLRYHVVLGSVIRTKQVRSGQHFTTLAGSGYQVSLRGENQPAILLQKYLVLGPFLSIISLSTLLEITIKKFCSKKNLGILRTECMSCVNARCPDGYKLLSRSPVSLVEWPAYLSVLDYLMTCRLHCVRITAVKSCCHGFFGRECEPCPGGVNNVCFKHGTCFDGLRGNGTCMCNQSNYSGIACDECSTGLFGQDCSSKCRCVNGSCDDGKNGLGTCFCNKGWRGEHCDVKVDLNDPCKGRCHSASECSSGPFSPTCICSAGYTGHASNCTPINVCKQQRFVGCHIDAACMHRGPGRYECKCKEGYQGDGTYCTEINPCMQANFTRCDSNANCFHTGPNQFHCLCKDGHTGDGKTCVPIDLCQTANGGCHPFAQCTMQAPGLRDCNCIENYIGDGEYNCTGRNDYEWLNQLDTSLTVGLLNPLSSKGPITLFIPRTYMMPNAPPQLDLQHLVILSFLQLSLVVGCEWLPKSRLQTLSSMRMLSGDVVNITTSNGNVYLDRNISIDEGQTFSNGMLFTTNGLLTSFKMLNQTTPSSIQWSNQKNNSLLLEATGLVNGLSQVVHGRWTLFLPSDKAFMKLPTHRMRQLTFTYSLELILLLLLYFSNRFHMIRQSMLAPTDIVQRMQLTTMQGSELRLACSLDRAGEIRINDDSTVIGYRVVTFRSSGGGMTASSLYIIDTVLEPPSIGGHCDIITNHTIEGTCSFCSPGRTMGCPSGMVKIAEKKTQCVSVSYSYFTCSTLISENFCSSHIDYIFDQISGDNQYSVAGCAPVCAYYNITQKCCGGYYGSDCHPCPGGADNTCSRNGVCSDGIDGSGKCTCNPGFHGYACELCETGRYGRKCLPCECTVNGICNEGINADGSCICDVGYTGINCDQRSLDPANCNHTCVQNAVCIEGPQCMCNPGYIGTGDYDCKLPDLCKTTPNGGCSPHASCTQNLLKVTCTCNFPYVGDGYICEGYDPCTDSARQMCHFHARCTYIGPNITRCNCYNGFIGDGINQCVPEVE
uniref:Stabilin 2 n=1 Tax=Ciona savignyi TaxID=51511 RepID=H2ZNA7_CIOSA